MEIKNGLSLAFSGHEGQFRKYSNNTVPYVQHPIRVAIKVAQSGPVPTFVLNAALGHDLLEDTDITPDAIREMCGDEALQIIYELTNPSKLPEHKSKPRAVRKRIDREHLKNVSIWARIIKLCDRIDNLTDMVDAPADFKKLYATESESLLEVLRGTHAPLEKELAKAIAVLKGD